MRQVGKRIISLLGICLAAMCVLAGCKDDGSSLREQQTGEFGADINTVVSTTSSDEAAMTTTTTTTTTAATTTTLSTTDTSDTTTEHSETETTTSRSVVAASGFVGAWDCTGVEEGGALLTLSESFGVEEDVFIDLIVYADGTFVITMSLDAVPIPGIWVEKAGSAVFTAREMPVNGVITNGVLTLYEDDEKMFFVKQE